MRHLLLIILSLLFTSALSQDKWEKLNGPIGGSVSGLAAFGDTIIAGVRGLIYYSLDAGNSWEEVDDKLPSGDFIKNNEGKILAVTSSGIYITADLKNWEQVLHTGDQFQCLGKDNYDNLFLGTGPANDGKIFISDNNGYSWNLSFNGGGWISNFLNLNDSIFIAGGWGKIITRKFNQTDWTIIQLDSLLINPIKVFKDEFNNLYAYMNSRIIFSSDAGVSWYLRDSLEFLDGNSIYDCIYNSNIIASFMDEISYYGTGYGVAVSVDEGWTWRWSNAGLPPRFSGAVRLTKSGNNTYLGTNAAGVFKSTNFGDSWFPINNDIIAATTLDICFDPEGKMYSANWSNGFQKSTDSGASWEVINTGLNDVYCMSIISDDSGILLGGTEHAIYRSTNKGLNWGSAGIAGNNFAFHLEKDKQNRIYALTYGTGLYRSTNTGLSWVKIDNGFISGFVLGFTIDSSGTIFAGTRQGAIYKSTNDGQNWTRVYLSSNPNSVVSTIKVAPNGYIYAANINEGILRSTDSGATWQIFTNGFSSLQVRKVAANSKGELYASTYDKLYQSTDMGESWSDVTEEMYFLRINEIYVTDTDDMFFATNESIWRNNPDSTTAVSDNNITVSEYKLYQNYPNPFNPSTKISYTLKDEGYVKLNIYDIKGELLSTLVNKKQQSGNYEVDFKLPGNISTGVYIYRLTVTDNNSTPVFSDVKKMVYLK